MKIELKNFRCFNSRTFEFPDSGLVLISGESGVGKSTIFCAISYALFGGPASSYHTFGKKVSCSVTLEIDNIKITRSSRPNQLFVTYDNVQYESDEAQDIIYETIRMTKDEFLSSSSLSDVKGSIISLNNAERAKLIRSVCLDDEACEKHKSIVKSNLDKYKEEIKSNDIKMDTIRKFLDKNFSDEDIENFNDNPENVDDIPNVKADIAKHKDKIAQLKESISDLEKLQDEYNSHQEQYEENRKKKRKLETKLRDLQDDLKNLIFLSPKKITQIKTTIEEYTQQLKYIAIYSSIIRNQEQDLQRLEKTKEEYNLLLRDSEILEELKSLDDMEKNLRDMKDRKKNYPQLLKEYNKYSQFEKEISDIEGEIAVLAANLNLKFSSLKKTLVFLNEERERISKILSLDGDSIYKCPNCEIYLSVDDCLLKEIKLPKKFNLDEHRSNCNSSIIHNKITLSNIENIIPKIERIIEFRKIPKVEKPEKINAKEISQANSILEEIREKNRKFQEAKSFNYKSQAKKIREKCDKEANEVTNLLSKYVWENLDDISNLEKDISAQLVELRNILSDEESKKTQHKEKVSQIEKIETKLKALEKKKNKSINIDDVISSLTLKKEKLMGTQDDLQISVDYLERLTRYQEYETWKSKNDSISKLEKVSKELNGLLKDTCVLKDLIEEAEKLSIEKTLTIVNECANRHLLEMFDSPIDINVSLDKINIEYKGSEYKNINQLSTGERQRVELAFISAMAEVKNTPLVLIDECFNNLDSEMNFRMVEYIKEINEKAGRLVLIISHEAIQGIFTDVVNVK